MLRQMWLLSECLNENVLLWKCYELCFKTVKFKLCDWTSVAYRTTTKVGGCSWECPRPWAGLFLLAERWPVSQGEGYGLLLKKKEKNVLKAATTQLIGARQLTRRELDAESGLLVEFTPRFKSRCALIWSCSLTEGEFMDHILTLEFKSGLNIVGSLCYDVNTQLKLNK